MKVYSVKNGVNTLCFMGNDTKKSSKHGKTKTIAAAALGGIISSVLVYKLSRPTPKACSDCVKSIAEGLSALSTEKVAPKSLSCVMDKNEFLEVISSLKEGNYRYSAENIKNFGFLADFHMHTIHSDGKISVPQLLEEISEYSNNLFKRTGKKFMFSLTDHDSVEGVKEALSIIEKKPEKYRNIKFIPGVELSFSHRAPNEKNPFEISEVLAYGINPFKFDKFCKNLQQKRSNCIDKMLDDICKLIPLTKFSRHELIEFYELNPECIMMNSHWQVFHYAQTKHALTIQASRKGVNPEIFYAETMKNIDIKQRNVSYLKQNNLLDHDINESDIISNIREKYHPNIINGKFVTPAESKFSDIIDALKDDGNVILAFAHPYFTAKKVNNPITVLNDFINNSKGLLQLSEGYHQAYPADVNMDEVKKVNGYLNKLMQIGGSDNHKEVYIL